MICSAKLTNSKITAENQFALRAKRFVKVVSENKTMPYNVSSWRNGYNHTKGTSAKSDHERYGTDDDRSPQWDPRPVDYNKRHIRGPQRGTAMQYRSRTESKRSERSESDRSDSGN